MPNRTRRHTRPVPSGARPPQPDVYQTVTDTIMAQLEEGVFPWAKPWDPSKGVPMGTIGLPTNPLTGRSYSGINVLLLWIAADTNGYADHRWMTYKQSQSVGAQVRRGEASTQIVKAGTFSPRTEREQARRENRDPEQIPFLKFHRVFNVAQIDGLPSEYHHEPSPPDLSAIDGSVRAILDELGVHQIHGTARACYVPSADCIQLPSLEAFDGCVASHASVALHECGHATGARHRLDRDLTGWFGGEDYAKEELIAELTAAYCCAALGLAPKVRHTDYIACWLKKLRDDKRCVVHAASAASKAADLLLDLRSKTGLRASTQTNSC